MLSSADYDHPNFGGCEYDPGWGRVCVLGPPAHCAGEINVPDANLAAAIRDALGLADADPITFSTALTSLTANHRNITDITGLECFVHLEYLNLSNNSITEF